MFITINDYNSHSLLSPKSIRKILKALPSFLILKACPHQEKLFRNISKQFPNNASCPDLSCHRMPVSVEIVAAASAFYLALLIIHSRMGKKKKSEGIFMVTCFWQIS